MECRRSVAYPEIRMQTVWLSSLSRRDQFTETMFPCIPGSLWSRVFSTVSRPTLTFRHHLV